MAVARASKAVSQAQAFLDGVGDDYYQRNKKDFGQREDLVEHVLKGSGYKPTSVLEIGSADGWRLKRIQKQFNCRVVGIEPSREAVRAANMNGVPSAQGAAQDLSMFRPASFDLVIFGYCLWLCNPEDWFFIAGESNRVLVDKGRLIIHDCIPPRALQYFYAPPNATEREKKMSSWLADHTQLWRAHPGYKFVGEASSFMGFGTQQVLAIEHASMFMKDMVKGFPLVGGI